MGKVSSDWDDSAHMHAELTQTIVSKGLQDTSIGVSRVRSERRDSGMTDPYAPQQAYLVVLQLRPFADQTLWVDGKRAPHAPFQEGGVAIYDLDRLWIADLKDPYDCLHFYLPQVSLDMVADEVGGRPGMRLELPPHENVRDETVHGIGRLLLPALAGPQDASALFVDHLALALHAHVAQRYGRGGAPARSAKGGLAAWQLRRAKDFMLSHLSQDMSLDQVAKECGLSRSHFITAFRKTAGLPPHQWLMAQRVAQAKALMRGAEVSLAEVAVVCGFSDQSHFSRCFARAVGSSPSAWRLAHRLRGVRA